MEKIMKSVWKTNSDISVYPEPDELIAFSKVTFHESIKFLLITAQFFGVMPLKNITKDATKVHFNWKSFGVLYSLSNSIASFLAFIFWVIKIGRDGLYIDKTAPLCFYFCTCVASLAIIQIANNWANIVKEWNYVEIAMRGYREPPNLKRKFITLSASFLLVGSGAYRQILAQTGGGSTSSRQILHPHGKQIILNVYSSLLERGMSKDQAVQESASLTKTPYSTVFKIFKGLMFLYPIILEFHKESKCGGNIIELVEHCLFILNGIAVAQNCKGYSENPVRTFFEVSFENYFTVVKYTPVLAVYVKFFNTIATFTWIFTDLLVILISIALTSRFKQITIRMKNTKVFHEKFLREIRRDYQRLFHLYKEVQQHFSTLVLISFVQNIFFLCIQLYNSLRERTGIIEPIYFFYSFGFLVLRILAVSLYGACLYEEGQKPLLYLHNVPTEFYCTEVTRLMEQIYINPVAMTGSGFFVVTKNFLLQIAGTVVTFELMIFQFAPVNHLKYLDPYNCTV